VNAAIRGDLDGVDHVTDPIFGLRVPARCPGVPSAVLQPCDTWSDGDAYDRRPRVISAPLLGQPRPDVRLVLVAQMSGEVAIGERLVPNQAKRPGVVTSSSGSAVIAATSRSHDTSASASTSRPERSRCCA